MKQQNVREVTVSDRTLAVCAAGREAPLTFRERTRIAEILSGAGVDAIELPAMTRPREETVVNRTIALAAGEVAVKIPVTCEEGVVAAYESIRDAIHPVLQVVMPTSTLGMEYRLHKKAHAARDYAVSLCRAAREIAPAVEFVAEDASRAEPAFLSELMQDVIAVGVTSFVLCDDAGNWLPEEAAATVRALVTPACSLLIRPAMSLGLASAVAAAALTAGAAGVVTGIGGGSYPAAAFSDLLTARGETLGLSSRLVATAIHRETEEIDRTAGGVGGKRQDPIAARIALGADATVGEVSDACNALGYELSDEDIAHVVREVQRVAEKKESIDARELEAIVATAAMQVPSTYHLVSYLVSTGNVISPMAEVTLKTGERTQSGVSMGDGPIDAAFRALEQIIGHHYELDDFEIQSVTEGRGAVGSALVKLRHDGRLYAGQGISTDIIGASVRAYLNALNKIIYEDGRE